MVELEEACLQKCPPSASCPLSKLAARCPECCEMTLLIAASMGGRKALLTHLLGLCGPSASVILEQQVAKGSAPGSAPTTKKSKRHFTILGRLASTRRKDGRRGARNAAGAAPERLEQEYRGGRARRSHFKEVRAMPLRAAFCPTCAEAQL